MAQPQPLIALSDRQLQALIAETVARTTARLEENQQQTLTEALQALNINGPTGGSAKDIRFADITPFSGKPEDFQPFIQECLVRFEIQSGIYTNAARKAGFILSHFKTGNARLWKEAYYNERAGKAFVEGDDFDAFVTLLRSSFTDSGRTQDALHELQNLRQGRRLVDELNTTFRTYMQKAGLDEARNAIVLINYYQKALNPKMVTEIILKGTATTLDEWMKIATQLDAAQRMINHMHLNIAQKSRDHRKTFKPYHYHSKPRTEHYGEPMDVDFIAPQERDRRFDQKLCFNCGKPGHIAAECRNRRNEQGPQSSKQPTNTQGKEPQQRQKTFGARKQGKTYPPKKKRTPQEARQHIRAIVNESFDPDSQEYRDFVEEIEKKGF